MQKSPPSFRFIGLLALCISTTFLLCGCVKIMDVLVDGMIEGSSDHRAEKAYRRQGASEKEAKQRVFEDEFFKDVGGRP
jgi:hypothetical protein